MIGAPGFNEIDESDILEVVMPQNKTSSVKKAKEI